MENLQLISKIFHIADVHIRNFKRHSEYKTIFKQLFKYIKENSGQHVHLVARSAWGKREYLYKKLPEEIFSIFKPIIKIDPYTDIVNSIIIFKK